MAKSDERRRQAAKAFVERWTFRRGSEKGEDQQFWNDLLRSVLGVDDVESRIRYQVPVPMGGTTKFLDAWIPETRVLVEHKSRGVDLSAPPLVVRLRDLPKEAHRLAFLVDPKEKAVDRELEISVQAGRIVGELYDALLERYQGAPDALAALNRLCVRLVFCLYAEDAGVLPKDCFRRLVEATPAEFLRARLVALFRVLDTPVAERDPYLEPELAAFPYTNGGLFRVGLAAKGLVGRDDPIAPRAVGRDDPIAPRTVGRDDPIAPRAVGRGVPGAPRGLDDIPPLTEEIRQLLLGASRFDWREITPHHLRGPL